MTTAAQRRAAARAAAESAPAIITRPEGAPADRRTVIVACKLGISRFELQLCEMRDVQENTQTGPRTVQQGFKSGEVWVVRGTAYPEGTPPKGFIKRAEDCDGYALTRNIPKVFWDRWLIQNGKAPMVTNRLIFAAETMDEVEGMAHEYRDVKSDLAPLDMPDREGEPVDARVPRSVHQGVGNIERMTTT